MKPLALLTLLLLAGCSDPFYIPLQCGVDASPYICARAANPAARAKPAHSRRWWWCHAPMHTRWVRCKKHH